MNIENKTLKLNNAYKKISKLYGAEFIFGVYCYGEKNEVEAVIIPRFEEVCLSQPLTINVVEGIMIKDIRCAYDATKRGHGEMINALYAEDIIIAPRYQHLYENLLIKHRDEIKEGMECGKPSEHLEVALVKILRTAWNDTSNVVKFIKQLTDAEKTGLEGIVAAIGDEGCFSQAKVAAAIGISRLTMTKLVEKIEKHDVGYVEFRGVKGTYIQFKDDTVLDIRGTNDM